MEKQGKSTQSNLLVFQLNGATQHSDDITYSENQRALVGPSIMSKEELKIRNELLMDIERDLEEEIKEGIYHLALRLDKLYRHQRERKASTTLKPSPSQQLPKNKTLSEVNINIKMEGGTKIEIKEIKREVDRTEGRVHSSMSRSEVMASQDAKKLNWVKTLRSRDSGRMMTEKKRCTNAPTPRNSIVHNEYKLRELGWKI
ncbi:hypothetical protein RJ641_011644 [Dillenia turbinata]|uniref:Uncharacterized protein n=1 Tax=Dillenia turbinata TaxID=194707 RepID=A0AAN8Z5J9_9MAGN